MVSFDIFRMGAKEYLGRMRRAESCRFEFELVQIGFIKSMVYLTGMTRSDTLSRQTSGVYTQRLSSGIDF